MSFTGSGTVGRKVLHASGESNVKRITLELGGKSPNIVFDDCDLEQAVDWSVFGVYKNTGQVCAANTRIYVHKNIYDQFLEKFTAKVKTLHIGTAFDPDMNIGPLNSQVQLDVSTFFCHFCSMFSGVSA